MPTRGMERWLTQRLSAARRVRRDGICANVEFPFPRAADRRRGGGRLGHRPGRRTRGCRSGSSGRCWRSSTSASQSRGSRRSPRTCRPSRARRFAAVRHLADLFDRYALHRPELVRAGRPATDDHWQAELWRRLRARIGAPDPAERLAAACARLRAEPGARRRCPSGSRCSASRGCPPASCDVLRALAEHRDVHLFLLHPSPALWERLAAPRRASCAGARRPHGALPAQPPARLVGAGLARAAARARPATSADHEHPVEHRDGHAARAPAGRRARGPRRRQRAGAATDDAASRSTPATAARARSRSLRDAILHLLDDDPTLEPRDVIVMCPDIEAFAPLIQATFGAGEIAEDEDDELAGRGRPPDLRVRLADRSLRQTNPVLGVVARLLELAEAAADRLAGARPRRPRAGPPPLPARRRRRSPGSRTGSPTAASAGGWTPSTARRSSSTTLPAGTWRARAGPAAARRDDDRGRAAAVRRRAAARRRRERRDRPRRALRRAGRPAARRGRRAARRRRPSPEWAAALAAAADALTATAPRDALAARRAAAAARRRRRARRPAHDGRSTLAEVRALLAERLQGRPTRANFRTGHLTICTLVPMRSVPHRVVCLLGLDDGAFPRKAPRDGDDLLLADPHVGDRDARTEDRQLLLDALMAATDRLIITYTGNDERTNVAAPARGAGRRAAGRGRSHGAARRVRRRHRHPLQPFDPRNFEPGGSDGTPWSFDRVTLEGARALAGRRAEPRAVPAPRRCRRASRAADRARGPGARSSSTRCARSCASGSGSASATAPTRSATRCRSSSTASSSGRSATGCSTRGSPARDGRTAIRAEIARGDAPARVSSASRSIAEVWPMRRRDRRAGRGADRGATPRRWTCASSLDDGRRLTGTVAGVRGTLLRTVTYSTRQRRATGSRAWVRLLALCAAYPDRALRGA